MGEMNKLSIGEILKATNHDFVNQLQLIKMYLDLNRIDDAKNLIENYCNQAKTYSNVCRLQWPKTIEWIQTFQYRFPAIELTLKSNVSVAQNMKKDDETVEYLEKAIQHVYKHLDPFNDQQLLLEVKSNEEEFKLSFELKGKWNVEPFQNEQLLYMKVKTIEESTSSWKFVLTFKE